MEENKTQIKMTSSFILIIYFVIIIFKELPISGLFKHKRNVIKIVFKQLSKYIFYASKLFSTVVSQVN